MQTNPSTEDVLTDNSVFIVREARGVDFTFSSIFIILTLIIAVHIIADYRSDQIAVYYKLVILTLLPAISFIVRGIQNKIALTIDKTGIYRKEKLLTSWDHFISAKIMQDAITGSYTDDFVLFIDYEKEGEPGIFIRKIKISNSWNKSEEEMIAAIHYFSKFSNKHSVQEPE